MERCTTTRDCPYKTTMAADPEKNGSCCYDKPCGFKDDIKAAGLTKE